MNIQYVSRWIVVLISALAMYCSAQDNPFALKALPQAAYYNEAFANLSVPIFGKVEERYYPIGTGFFITHRNRGFLVTNRHIFDSSFVLYVSINVSDSVHHYLIENNITQIRIGPFIWIHDGRRLYHKIETRNSDGTRRYVLHPSYPTYDIAVIPCFRPYEYRGMRATNVEHIDATFLCADTLINYGQYCYMVGYPDGIGAFNPYNTKPFRGRNGDTIQVRTTPLEPITPVIRFGAVAWKNPSKREVWVDSPSFRGNSGSPVFARIDADKPNGERVLVNKLIGVNKSTLRESNTLDYMDYAILVPASVLRELLDYASTKTEQLFDAK